MKQNKYILFLILGFMVLGCGESEDAIDNMDDLDEHVDLSFTMKGTRSGSTSSTTYRAMLHHVGTIQDVHPYTGTSGTYRGPNTDERVWLTACQVNSTTGVWQQDTHQYGLRASRGSYYLSFVSPGVAPQQYQYNEETESYEKWGFLHHRQPQAGEPELYICKPYYIRSLTGNHLNGEYVHDVPDSVILKERRAKITVRLKCGEDLLSATVKKLGWSNLYESAYYNLAIDSLDNMTLSASTDTVMVYEPATPLTLLHGGEPVEVCKDFFLFPFYYAKKDEFDNYVYDVPELDIYVAQGVAKLKVFHNIEPQYSYTYTVTINSAYVSVVVTAAPWDEPATMNPSIDSPSSTDKATFSISTWDDKVPSSGSI